MTPKKSTEQIKYNMSRVRNSETNLENPVSSSLVRHGITTFIRNDKSVYGKPDFTFPAKKIAIFCDGDFWHGYDWYTAQNVIKNNRDFWIAKIEKNISRDAAVTKYLEVNGWTVLRFWGHQIIKELPYCISAILSQLRKLPLPPYKTIDLCDGIGGVRRGFELAGNYVNILSSESDIFARKTYSHLFGEYPDGDLTTKDFKMKLENIQYDILLARFPCPIVESYALSKNFSCDFKDPTFYHVAEIIRRTRPFAFFFESESRLVFHNKGRTYKTVVGILTRLLGYHVIGVNDQAESAFSYDPKNFLRNSMDFGTPLNRNRSFIIGFDTERISSEKFRKLPNNLPLGRSEPIYKNLNTLLDSYVNSNFYLSSGFWNTLNCNKAKRKDHSYGYGYRVINEPEINRPVAYALQRSGSFDKERNLIYDPRFNFSGWSVIFKQSPINDCGIRFITPQEWGKLQGFINYAFVNNEGNDSFSFPDGISNRQKYKLLGSSSTIPLTEEMGRFLFKCTKILEADHNPEVV